jgi:hypothetical protein
MDPASHALTVLPAYHITRYLLNIIARSHKRINQANERADLPTIRSLLSELIVELVDGQRDLANTLFVPLGPVRPTYSVQGSLKLLLHLPFLVV